MWPCVWGALSSLVESTTTFLDIGTECKLKPFVIGVSFLIVNGNLILIGQLLFQFNLVEGDLFEHLLDGFQYDSCDF